MPLNDLVHISGRFLRSIRIDTDSSEQSLEGFVFPASLKELLLNMGSQQEGIQQSAYTWTGPYGSGKSSLAMVFSQLLGSPTKNRNKAATIVGDDDFVSQLQECFPPKREGWRFLNVIGELRSPHETIKRRLIEGDFLSDTECSSESDVIKALVNIANDRKKESGGLIVVIDEMGKFLENSANGSNDIYFFQLLAEEASRSNGRLIVIGILHQAFQEYANNLGRNIRDEWSKIQGRYADIPVNISGEEQVNLIAQAIVSEETPKRAKKLAESVGNELKKSNLSYGEDVTATLLSVWPLHPITALMLGPVSRRSYGQNQRSIFTFLSSAEPLGFQDFLKRTSIGDEVFSPSYYWDYLLQNLQSSLAVSDDSHHFSTAREAIDRCLSLDGSDDEIGLLKSIALLELTRQQTGLTASLEVLSYCLPLSSKNSIEKAIQGLERKSLIVYREYRGSYGLFEGSDFDIEGAIEDAAREVSKVDLSSISDAIGVSMISAKRHYHKTGTMRWCDFVITPVDDLMSLGQQYNEVTQSFGLVALALPTNDESDDNIISLISKAQKLAKNYNLLVATSPNTHRLVSLAKDHTFLAHIKENCREIDRDKVARREIKDRLEAVTNLISQEVWAVLESAEWYIGQSKKQRLNWPQINSIVSDLASKRYPSAPIIHNELINRRTPSGSANGALKLLLHAMVMNGEKEQLGFEKFPAEKGLFCSIVEPNNLHVRNSSGWHFVSPSDDEENTLHSLWLATSEYLAQNSNRSVSLGEIYELWRSEPFGVCDGIMPLFAVLYLLTEKSNLAYYREGIFLSSFSDIDVDYLLKAPNLIDFRWMDMSELSRQLLSNMADVASDLTKRPVLNLEPLDVARGLIAAFESAAQWVHRTSRLSQNAIQIRSLFKRSNDPNKFLFDDIPALYAGEVDVSSSDGIKYITKHIEDGLKEILGRYTEMLHKLRDQVLHELQVPSKSPQAIKELNDRATNIKGITGEMRLEAFIGRLTSFDNSDEAIEKLVGLGVNKPAKTWVDSDVDRAAIALIEFARNFNKSEAYAQVEGRKNKRDAMAVVVGLDGRPVIQDFSIMDSERAKVSTLAADIEKVFSRYKDLPQNIALAALATVSATVVDKKTVSEDEEANNG